MAKRKQKSEPRPAKKPAESKSTRQDFVPPPDFYGSVIKVNPDGSTTTTRHGGHGPRTMTAEEFQPWFELIRKRIERKRAAAAEQATAESPAEIVEREPVPKAARRRNSKGAAKKAKAKRAAKKKPPTKPKPVKKRKPAKRKKRRD
jgi:hypothetical protein